MVSLVGIENYCASNVNCKDRDAGKNRWQEKGAGGEGLTEDETVGWHH